MLQPHPPPKNRLMIPKIVSCRSKGPAHGAAWGQDPRDVVPGLPTGSRSLLSIFTFPSHPPQTAPLHSSICLNATSGRDWLQTASPLVVVVTSPFSSSGFACLIPGIRILWGLGARQNVSAWGWGRGWPQNLNSFMEIAGFGVQTSQGKAEVSNPDVTHLGTSLGRVLLQTRGQE